MRLSIMNKFDRNFWALRLPYALSKYKKRVSRQKIKESRSLNRFPTILPSYFRCLIVSPGTAPSNVVFNFGVYLSPLGRPGVGKRFFVKSHGLGRIYKWSLHSRDQNWSEVPTIGTRIQVKSQGCPRGDGRRQNWMSHKWNIFSKFHFSKINDLNEKKIMVMFKKSKLNIYAK